MMGSGYSVYLYDPEDIEKVFRSDQKCPFRTELPLTRTLEKRTGIPAALGTLKDEDWKKRRKPLQNLIQKPQVISHYVPDLSDIADDFLEKLHGNDEFEDVFHQLMEFTSEGVGFICFNRRLGNINKSTENKQSDLLAHTTKYLEHLGEQFFRIPWFKLFKSRIYNEFAESYQYIYDFTANEISRCKQRIGSSPETDDRSLVSGLLKDGGLSQREVVTGVVDVFVGGIDSTASAITFLISHLAQNPVKQERLYNEVKQFRNQRFTSDILQHLPYTKACIKESFRLIYPVPGGTVRVLDKDIEIKGYHIEKGTNILLCSGSVCLNEDYFHDPESFIPERWLRNSEESQRQSINSFAHLPFGYGPRNCLGQRLAEMQISLMIAKMFGKYEFSMPENVSSIPYRYTAFPIPLQPVTMRMRKR